MVRKASFFLLVLFLLIPRPAVSEDLELAALQIAPVEGIKIKITGSYRQDDMAFDKRLLSQTDFDCVSQEMDRLSAELSNRSSLLSRTMSREALKRVLVQVDTYYVEESPRSLPLIFGDFALTGESDQDAKDTLLIRIANFSKPVVGKPECILSSEPVPPRIRPSSKTWVQKLQDFAAAAHRKCALTRFVPNDDRNNLMFRSLDDSSGPAY